MVQFDKCVELFGKIILSKLYKNNVLCWVAGGSVRDYFSSNNSKLLDTDFDIFFPDDANYAMALKFFTDEALKVNDSIKVSKLFENENGYKIKYGDNTFDLVKKHFNSPKETIDNFDFTVSQFAVDGTNVYYGESSFVDLSKKQLVINKILYPASTYYRAFKYYVKGYRMCKGEMLKIIKSLQEMPSIITLEDQQLHNKSNDTDTSDIEESSFNNGLDKLFFGID